MAFAMLMFKANRINNKKIRLRREKENAIRELVGEKVKHNIADRYTHAIVNCKEKMKNCCSRIFSFPKNSRMHRISVKMRYNGTLENFLLKSIVGFAAGFFLIYIFFMFFVIILQFGLASATLICSVFGCILTVGLAFSEKVRCVVCIILPHFFSKRGRQALLAYAFVLALTGPVRNTLNNLGILSESLACGQEQLKEAVRQIIDVIKKPFIAIKEAIKKVIKVIKEIIKVLKEIFLTIKRIVLAIARVIKAAFQFLGKIFNICSKKVGTPFERCVRVFDGAITDCYAKMGPMFDWLCSIVYVTQYICYIVKPLDLICMLLDFISNSIVGIIIRKIKKFIRHVRSTFYVRIRFSHSFAFETKASKSVKEVTEGIVNEIKHRTRTLNKTFNLISGLTSMFFFVVIVKAIYYRYKFLTAERFDNTYINKYFRQIDFRRAQMDKETVLPLNNRERKKYVTAKSVRLTPKEGKKLFKAISVITSATFKLGAHIATDYAFYWVLEKIRFYGKYANTVDTSNTVGLKVQGRGFVAKLFRTLARAFNPLGKKMHIDTVPCLPDPIPPDYDKYIQIVFIIFLCWIMTICEPYGLRLRQAVMVYYYPARARQRAIWLYNHILRNRTSFLKFARRKLKRQFFGHDSKDTKMTCKEILRAKINVRCLRWFLGSEKQDACVLCAEVFRPGDESRPIRCATPGCPGMYCEQCFSDLRNLCTICLDPIQYGDLSDIDEEMDSSEDQTSNKFKRRRSKQKKREKELKRVYEFPSCPCTPEDEGSCICFSSDEEKETLPIEYEFPSCVCSPEDEASCICTSSIIEEEVKSETVYEFPSCLCSAEDESICICTSSKEETKVIQFPSCVCSPEDESSCICKSSTDEKNEEEEKEEEDEYEFPSCLCSAEDESVCICTSSKEETKVTQFPSCVCSPEDESSCICKSSTDEKKEEEEDEYEFSSCPCSPEDEASCICTSSSLTKEIKVEEKYEFPSCKCSPDDDTSCICKSSVDEEEETKRIEETEEYEYPSCICSSENEASCICKSSVDEEEIKQIEEEYEFPYCRCSPEDEASCICTSTIIEEENASIITDKNSSKIEEESAKHVDTKFTTSICFCSSRDKSSCTCPSLKTSAIKEQQPKESIPIKKTEKLLCICFKDNKSCKCFSLQKNINKIESTSSEEDEKSHEDERKKDKISKIKRLIKHVLISTDSSEGEDEEENKRKHMKKRVRIKKPSPSTNATCSANKEKAISRRKKYTARKNASSTSSYSTEYSYSYQYNKDFKEVPVPLRDPFIDLEKQRIPDYASMDTFNENNTTSAEITETKSQPNPAQTEIRHATTSDSDSYSGSNPIIKKCLKRQKFKLNTSSLPLSSEDSDDIPTPKSNPSFLYYSRENRRKIIKWLSGKSMFRQRRRSDAEESIPLLDITVPEIKISISDDKTSKDFRDTNITTTEKKTETTTSFSEMHTNDKLNFLFPHVNYSEENETPRSVNSTVIIELQPKRKCTKLTCPNTTLDSFSSNSTTNASGLRQRRTQENPFSEISANGNNCNTASGRYKRKVCKYYKHISNQQPPAPENKTNTKNRFVELLSRFRFFWR